MSAHDHRHSSHKAGQSYIFDTHKHMIRYVFPSQNSIGFSTLSWGEGGSGTLETTLKIK